MSNKSNSPYAMYATDKVKERDGVWLDFGTFGIKVRRVNASNKEFAKMAQKELKPHAKAIKRNTMDADLGAEISLNIFCHTVITDWRTTIDGKHENGFILDSAGEQLEFSAENAITLFEQLPDLFNEVYQMAEDSTNFLIESDTETAKK